MLGQCQVFDTSSHAAISLLRMLNLIKDDVFQCARYCLVCKEFLTYIVMERMRGTHSPEANQIREFGNKQSARVL